MKKGEPTRYQHRSKQKWRISKEERQETARKRELEMQSHYWNYCTVLVALTCLSGSGRSYDQATEIVAKDEGISPSNLIRNVHAAHVNQIIGWAGSESDIGRRRDYVAKIIDILRDDIPAKFTQQGRTKKDGKYKHRSKHKWRVSNKEQREVIRERERGYQQTYWRYCAVCVAHIMAGGRISHKQATKEVAKREGISLSNLRRKATVERVNQIIEMAAPDSPIGQRRDLSR